MVRKSKGGGRRRGIQRGVQKHKIKVGSVGQRSIFDLLNYFIPKGYLGKFYKLADECFFLYAQSCCRLYLVPLIMTANRKLAPAPRKYLAIHYAVLSALLISMLHKLGVVLYRLAYEDMNTYTFMCAACFLNYLVTFTAAFSNLFQVQDTVALINGWPKILACYPDEDGKVLPVIANTKSAVVVLALGVLAFVIGTAMSGFSIVFRALPLCYLPMVEAVGLVPVTSGWTRLMMKLLFWPLELVTYLLPMILAGWSTQVIMTAAMVVKNCMKRIRQATAHSFEDRLRLWNQYVRLQAFNAIFNSWLKYTSVLTISSVSSAIIISLYVTLRHTDLPIMLYIVFPYVGLSLMGLLFFICFELIMTTRSSGAILGTLSSTEYECYTEFAKPLKQYIKKRGKATKALAFNIGEFVDFSFDVPVGIWEEILNQLVFLLSF